MTEAALFYEQARPGLGDIFIDDIEYAINTVRERPMLGEEIGYGFRRTLARRFPFTIIYFIEANEVVVAAVAHQSRRPDYWKERM